MEDHAPRFLLQIIDALFEYILWPSEQSNYFSQDYISEVFDFLELRHKYLQTNFYSDLTETDLERLQTENILNYMLVIFQIFRK